MKPVLAILILIFIITFYRLYSHKPTKSEYQFTPAYVRLNQPTNIIDQKLKRLFPEPQASLLSGILVGTKAQMPKKFYDNLQKTGTMHIIALSGTNISFLIIGISLFLGSFIKKSTASILTIITIISFIFFVGPSPSVVRAGLMGSVQMLSTIYGRQYLALYALLFSGMIIIVIRPEMIFDIGFQLSFMATLGLIVLGGGSSRIKSKNIISRLKHALLINLKYTLAAQIFTLPIVIYNFQQMSFVAPLSNILVGWTVSILMSGGFLIAFLSFVPLISLAAPIFSWLLLPLLCYFVEVINLTASVPHASTSIGHFPLWGAYLYYAVLFLLIGFKSKLKNEN